MTESKEFSGWAIIEIMGHNKFAGYVSSQPMAGASLVRVDVPECVQHGAFSKLFGVSSVYCITPVSEEVARAMASSLRAAPVSIYDFPEHVLKAMRGAAQKALTGPSDEYSEEEGNGDDEPF